MSDGYNELLAERLRCYEFPFSLGPNVSKSTSSQPQAKTPQAELVDTIYKLGAQGEDLDAVKEAAETAETAEARYRTSIETSLHGVTNLAVKSKPKARRFVIAYWLNQEAKTETAEGVLYPDERPVSERTKDAISIVNLVHLQVSYGAFLSRSYNTLDRLAEHLDEAKIPYSIAYFDN
jgi:hypothetical protein